ncbi:N-acetylmuramoyl-L-alanine amidase [Gramella jeungdoensis]|uniref:N-acetylmuramoyl-L-alanine amidase n=1 Tax=Gramella jeungdoensis TaxID=708091 RepID=A0ABT0Z1R9_9FLAO|nr:N-acetylmuramoyl-L-alanine amidase [Gramella jeungdoensis]MCM8569677.1 N-acetylmuramoyl-L-alanine amidase [Gramella jeungdoensis]
MRISFSILGIFILLLTACSPNPYRKTNRIHKKQLKRYAKELRVFPMEQEDSPSQVNYGPYPVGTTNFNLRRPNYVVIHHTAQDSVRQTLNTFTIPRTQVSAHYVISDKGEVFHMLNDYFRAWHGGVGKWGNNTDLNSTSIGIELDNDGDEEFTYAQINSLLDLLKNLKEKYGIPTENFIGHSDIAPTRKVDPNANFPWKKLAEEGYGLWYDTEEVKKLHLDKDTIRDESIKSNDTLDLRTQPLPKQAIDSSLIVPQNFDPLLALRVIGYDISDPEAAIKAFKLHFIQENINAEFTDYELKVLYNLYQKYL